MTITLTAEQEAAVQAVLRHDRIAVEASPGSGKTRVLVAAYDLMLRSERAFSHTSVVITYTVAAANELKSRIRALDLPLPAYVGTIHGFLLMLLREHGQQIGLPMVSVADEKTANRVLGKQMKRHAFRGSFQQARQAVARQGSSNRTKEEQLRQSYHATMAKGGLVDFDGILYWAHRLLDGLATCRFTALFVDEYQDVSDFNHALLMSVPVQKRFVVGDTKQAIFGFIGGNPENLRKLCKDWPSFRLTINFRATRALVTTANSLSFHIDNGAHRMRSPNDEGIPPVVVRCKSPEHQIDRIKNWSESRSGTTAVLCRYNWQVAEIRTGLANLNIQVQGKGRIREPQDWDMLRALVAFLANPDSDIAAHALVANRKGEADADMLRETAIKQGVPLGRLVMEGSPEFSDFHDVMQVVPAEARALASSVAAECSSWAELNAALADPEIFSEAVNPEAVLVCTIHASKGLEFDNVALPYWNEELFPGAHREDEELRLAFVAITRAAKNLAIFHSAEIRPHPNSTETTPGNPSRFLEMLV